FSARSASHVKDGNFAATTRNLSFQKLANRLHARPDGLGEYRIQEVAIEASAKPQRFGGSFIDGGEHFEISRIAARLAQGALHKPTFTKPRPDGITKARLKVAKMPRVFVSQLMPDRGARSGSGFNPLRQATDQFVVAGMRIRGN